MIEGLRKQVQEMDSASNSNDNSVITVELEHSQALPPTESLYSMKQDLFKANEQPQLPLYVPFEGFTTQYVSEFLIRVRKLSHPEKVNMLRSNFGLGKNYFTEDSITQDLSEFNPEVIKELTAEQKFFLMTALEPTCNPYLALSQSEKKNGKFFVDK